jgi:hypothetical protein
MKYRKKPVVIDAMQFDGSNQFPLMRWAECFEGATEWTLSDGCIAIVTLEGEMRADPGDWIIRGVKGEFYPCKPDIFEATYERAENDA